jgi:toluene monooxygenase system ferredoxin subunit
MAFDRVLANAELWDGELRGVMVRGVPVLLLRLGSEVRAFVDRCAHQRMKLSEGRLDGRVLTCGAHGWSYDALTGEGVNPTGAQLHRLPVRVDGDALLVDVEDVR